MHLGFCCWRINNIGRVEQLVARPTHGGEAIGSSPFSATMETIIEKQKNIIKKYELPFSINDIVTVVTYGNMYVSQDKAYYCSTLRHSTKLNKWSYELTDYSMCDEWFNGLQWKVTDVGVFNESSVNKFVIRLINRDKEELLMQFDILHPDECLKIVRKGKKQYKEYIINL